MNIYLLITKKNPVIKMIGGESYDNDDIISIHYITNDVKDVILLRNKVFEYVKIDNIGFDIVYHLQTIKYYLVGKSQDYYYTLINDSSDNNKSIIRSEKLKKLNELL